MNTDGSVKVIRNLLFDGCDLLLKHRPAGLAGWDESESNIDVSFGATRIQVSVGYSIAFQVVRQHDEITRTRLCAVLSIHIFLGRLSPVPVLLWTIVTVVVKPLNIQDLDSKPPIEDSSSSSNGFSRVTTKAP